jgi:hypothetical protein
MTGWGRFGLVSRLTHLRRLKAESIRIMRETVAASERPGIPPGDSVNQANREGYPMFVSRSVHIPS